jgi:hypothetical protein
MKRESIVPTSDSTILYIRGTTCPLNEIMEESIKHFGPNVSLSDLSIGREHFHARCIGYDLYDPSDYDDYITIERNI